MAKHYHSLTAAKKSPFTPEARHGQCGGMFNDYTDNSISALKMVNNN